MPHLSNRLGDRWSRLAAARALGRLSVSTADLAEPLVQGLTDYEGRFGVATIPELRAVETVPLPRRLRMGTTSPTGVALQRVAAAPPWDRSVAPDAVVTHS